MTGLAVHLAATLRERAGQRRRRPRVVLGGDTRESTPEICRWLAAGLARRRRRAALRRRDPHARRRLAHPPARGRRRRGRLGEPQPLAGQRHQAASIRRGFKWSDGDEARWNGGCWPSPPASSAPGRGRSSAEPELRERYLRRLAATVPGSSPRRAAGGARRRQRRRLGLRRRSCSSGWGRSVILLHAEPDGRNVNEGCGSTAPGEMAARVVAEGADLGAAFDGDADRCILADERGEVRDGDAILYLWATCLHRSGRLHPPRIVATSMSNLGLERALRRRGDRHRPLRRGGPLRGRGHARGGASLLGGEQSGHIVQSELASTGDGLLTALQIAALRHADGRSLSAMLAPFRRYPQVLLNVRVAEEGGLRGPARRRRRRRPVEDRLGDDGRLVLRYSGTEPLARIMIEGPEQRRSTPWPSELAAAIRGGAGRDEDPLAWGRQLGGIAASISRTAASMPTMTARAMIEVADVQLLHAGDGGDGADVVRAQPVAGVDVEARRPAPAPPPRRSAAARRRTAAASVARV